jgi:hypothetical protein
MDIIINNYPIVVTLIIVALTVAAIFIGKRFGVKFINIAKSIIEFVANTLKSLELKDDKLGLVISLISQGITYAIAINMDNSIDTKVEDSLKFIQNISGQLGEQLTEDELEIIAAVLQVTFIFIQTLNIKPSFKYQRLVKYAAKLNK